MDEVTYDARRSRECMEQADAALARGDRVAAVEALGEAARFDPHNEELPLLAASLQLGIGEPVRAAHLAADALAVRPFHPAAVDVLGVACMGALQPGLARKVFRRGLAMAPGYGNLEKNLKDAKLRTREPRGSGIPRQEILSAANLLPEGRVRGLLGERKPELTACVLMRDGQEEAIEECLNSARRVASRLIVADARREPIDPTPREVEGPYEEWFATEEAPSTARNEALRRSRTDWVLFLDADERLEAGGAESLREAMEDGGKLAHVVELRPDHGAPRLAVRLVRNAPGVRFRGRLDARLHPSLSPLCVEWGLEVSMQPAAVLRVAESGTGPGVDDETAQTERELDRDLVADPENHVARIERARLRLEAGRAEEALQAVRQVKKTLVADPARRTRLELEEPTILEGRCLLRLERFAELLALVEEYHEEHPETPETLFLAGSAARALNDPGRSVDSFRRALSMDCAPGLGRPIPETSGTALPNVLGLASIDVAEFDQATAAFETALRRDPDNIEAELGRIAARHGKGEMETVLHELDRMVESHGDDPKVWIAGGILLGQIPQLAPALVAASLAGDLDMPVVPEPIREAVGRAVLAWFQRWAACGSWKALDRALVGIDRAERVLPGLAESTASWLEQGGQQEAADNVRNLATKKGSGRNQTR